VLPLLFSTATSCVVRVTARLKKKQREKKKQAEGVIPNRYQRMRVIKLEPQRGRVREEKEEKKKGGGNEEKYGFNEGKHKTHLALLRVGEVTASGEEAQQAVHELPLSPFLKKKTANV
jgi:hypothetical protein